MVLRQSRHGRLGLRLEHDGDEVVGEHFNTTDWGVGIRQGEDDIKAFVDVSLKLMFESGYLQDSLRKWWGGGVLDEYLRRIEKVFQE